MDPPRPHVNPDFSPKVTGSQLMTFLNSSIVLLLLGTILGAIGLFTWQRRDWQFKQEYQREQVLVDRRVQIVEDINSELGAFIADFNTAISVIKKDANQGQINSVINSYNETCI